MSGLFGTNGVRGIVNVALTADVALRLGKAIGTYFKGEIAVATDTRTTADMVKSAVMTGLMSVGCSVFDLGIVPVPTLQYYVKTHDHISGGVMITASHNSPEYNGVKCIFSDGTELGRDGEAKIEDFYRRDIACEHVNKIGDLFIVENATESYIDAIVAAVSADAIKKANMKIIVDCANGSASMTTPKLLDKLGVTTVTLNADPQGEYLRHANEPTEDNLGDLIALMKVTNSDLGIAQDLDGDRVVFISNTGEFISGDVSMAIMAKHILKKKTGKIVTPISTSSAVEKVVEENGGEIIYTPVGSPVVARKMLEEAAIFGGEENGGMIFPEFQCCRDPGMAIAKMLECIVSYGPIQDQVDEIPKYYVIKKDIECPEDKKELLYQHLKELCADGDLDETDGLKIFFEEGWVLARPSGTENKFRFFSESEDKAVAMMRINEFGKDSLEFLLSI